jgi:hypothetical protein
VTFSSHLSAQDTHLTFKDIPINGELSSFVEKLKKEGFLLEKIDGNIAILKGKFVNRDCEIYVFATPKTLIARNVTVYLPKETTWSSIKSDYHSFKASFWAKYGAPANSYEFFSKPYYEGDGYEMQALRLEKCTYASFWDVPEGTIVVKISEFEQISFVYEDKTNTEKGNAEKLENVMNDI